MQAYPSGSRGRSAKPLYVVGSNPTACSIGERMSWNYRILKHVDDAGIFKSHYPNGIIWYGIHEVYYDKNGEPELCSSDPVKVLQEDLEFIKTDLKMMLKATSKPVLNYSLFKDKEKNETLKSSDRRNAQGNKRERASKQKRITDRSKNDSK